MYSNASLWMRAGSLGLAEPGAGMLSVDLGSSTAQEDFAESVKR